MAARFMFACLASCVTLVLVMANHPKLMPSKYVQTSFDFRPNELAFHRRVYDELGSVSTVEEFREKLKLLHERTSKICNDLQQRVNDARGRQEYGPEMEEMLEMVRENRIYDDVLKDLVALSSEDSECKSIMNYNFLHALEAAKDRQNVFEHLWNLGHKLFKRCSQEAMSKLNGPGGETARRNLEKFFRKGLGLENISQHRLLDILKGINPNYIVEKFNWDLRTEEHGLGYTALNWFLAQYRQSEYMYWLRFVNFAAAMDNEKDPFEGKIELQILNEMYRICREVDLARPNIDHILSNWIVTSSIYKVGNSLKR